MANRAVGVIRRLPRRHLRRRKLRRHAPLHHLPHHRRFAHAPRLGNHAPPAHCKRQNCARIQHRPYHAAIGPLGQTTGIGRDENRLSVRTHRRIPVPVFRLKITRNIPRRPLPIRRQRHHIQRTPFQRRHQQHPAQFFRLEVLHARNRHRRPANIVDPFTRRVVEVKPGRNREQRCQRIHHRLGKGLFISPRDRRMNLQVTELQLRTRRLRLRPPRVLISFVVPQPGHIRPSIISTRTQYIHLVIGLWPLFRRIQRAIRPKIQSLRIPVPIGEDMTDNPVNLRIILRNAPVQIHPQRLTHIRHKILRRHLFGRWNPLRLRRQTEIPQLVIPLIPKRQIQFPVRPDLHAPRHVVITRRQPSQHHLRRAQFARCGVIGKPDDLTIQIPVRTRRIGDRRIRPPRPVHVGIKDIDKVIPRTLEQLRMQRHAQQPILPARRRNVVDGHQNLPLPTHRVHAGDPFPGPLRHPQLRIRSPGNLPRPGEPGDDHPFLKRNRP